jgi:hypothetical protein
VLLVRIGLAGPGVEFEEIARAALLVVSGATGAALAHAAASGGDDQDSAVPEARPAVHAR